MLQHGSIKENQKSLQDPLIWKEKLGIEYSILV